MKRTLCAVGGLAVLWLIWAASALAGIADSPLPVLQTGASTLFLYSVPGVLSSGGSVGTFFSCTSADTTAQQVGVELFSDAGGGPCNDAAATSVSVVPGATVTFGTTSSTLFYLNSILGCNFGGPLGSARILSTSKKLICTAFVADGATAPPTQVGWHLTIIAKLKQKAAN